MRIATSDRSDVQPTGHVWALLVGAERDGTILVILSRGRTCGTMSSCPHLALFVTDTIVWNQHAAWFWHLELLYGDYPIHVVGHPLHKKYMRSDVVTRQDNDSIRKQVTRRDDSKKKKMLALSGTDTMSSKMTRSVPGHQR